MEAFEEKRAFEKNGSSRKDNRKKSNEVQEEAENKQRSPIQIKMNLNQFKKGQNGNMGNEEAAIPIQIDIKKFKMVNNDQQPQLKTKVSLTNSEREGEIII